MQENTKHIIVVGGGFAGLSIVKKLSKYPFRVTLVDKNNYHQFAPLYYQVATAQIEPNSIVFPLRKEVRPDRKQNFILATVEGVDTENNILKTNVGDLGYDYLVLAMGADTNYYGMKNIMENAYPMKSVSEALGLRNHLLEVLEQIVVTKDINERKRKYSVAIIGGGATGVEIAGALSEMKRYAIPRDYPEIISENLRIILIEASPKVLSSMSEGSFNAALRYLKELGVEVLLGKHVTGYNGKEITFDDETKIEIGTVVWVSGIGACQVDGLNDSSLLGRGGRIKVNEFNQIPAYDNIFVLGDMCIQTEKKYPNGHPQVAPVAMQQGKNLATNLYRLENGKLLKPFRYNNKGTMAMIGRNCAVADIGKFKFKGFFAWIAWLFVHLVLITGFKNRVFVVFDWASSYIAHDNSLRLIIRTKEKEQKDI